MESNMDGPNFRFLLEVLGRLLFTPSPSESASDIMARSMVSIEPISGKWEATALCKIPIPWSSSPLSQMVNAALKIMRSMGSISGTSCDVRRVDKKA
jgi:hypothetical protein